MAPDLPRPGDALSGLLGRGAGAAIGLRVLTEAGVIRPYAPWTLASLVSTLLRWGVGPAGGFVSMAVRSPRAEALRDDRGSLTYRQVHQRSNALAHALAERGVREGDGVAVMCRNHRGFVDATVATAKLGADILYLNTAFAAPALAEVLERERPRLVVHDEEFTGLLAGVEPGQRLLAWVDRPGDHDEPTLDDLVAAYPTSDPAPPGRHSRVVILTSGTTGTPKGAPRSETGIEAAVAILERIPLRYGQPTHIAAPLFHTWGFAHLALSMLLGTPVVLRRRFDPEDCLRVVAEEDCRSLAVIPVMLQRILRLPEEVLASSDLSRLRVVAASGSALPGDLALDWMDRFGDTLYNVYGSTEVGYGSIATPADLRAAPGTAGRPPHGTVVRILGHDGVEVPQGTRGRIFVGNSILFEGYSGGGHKEVVDGLMSSGDIGYVDADGLLFVEGRDDDMVVSGGENVFPGEVEDCLARHPRVADVAVVGVPDPDFGQRLRAVVVPDGDVGEAELREWVRDRLARFKVPREVVFVPELPRNATGKILRSQL